MIQSTGCCEPFDPKPWEDKTVTWKEWTTEMQAYVEKKNKKIKKLYFSYTTCPKCAKAYGKNYVVLFAQIA